MIGQSVRGMRYGVCHLGYGFGKPRGVRWKSSMGNGVFEGLRDDLLRSESGDGELNGQVDNVGLGLFLDMAGSDDCAMLDARSPGEFEQGHINGAYNLPLLSNDERAAVGTCYKQVGRAAAIDLGLEIVQPKAQMLAHQAVQFLEHSQGSSLAIYCARGGLRSNLLAQFLQGELKSRGKLDDSAIVLHGGYKSFRNFALNCYQSSHNPRLVVLGGKTGSGKTSILSHLHDLGEQVIDLEQIAKHYGSAFGKIGWPEAQPTNEQFSNTIALTWRGLSCEKVVFIEDEGAHIGNCQLPPELYALIRNSPFVYNICVPKSRRVQNLVDVYAGRPALSRDEAPMAWLQDMVAATKRIGKRLGPTRTQLAISSLESGDYEQVANILIDYYDKTYERHLYKNRDRLNIVDISMDDENLTYNAFTKQILEETYKLVPRPP